MSATDDVKARQRAMWALGDYPRVAATIAELGRTLVQACGIGPGQRVLDVGAGAGNASIPAAAAGAQVVAVDLTPQLLERGLVAAQEAGVTIEWREADAEALPFPDASFDVVMSSVGAMFAPDHQAVADELVRVCRPGGTIGMVNWTPEGWAGRFSEVTGPFMPPPPAGSVPPVLWGSEDHVRELFADRVRNLSFVRRVNVLEIDGEPEDVLAFYRDNFGPTMVAYRTIGDDDARREAFEAAFLRLLRDTNSGPADGPMRFGQEYVVVTARRA
jgi:2-polyprenyl-6-hydroxyphenyl methylase/3-demethylubiquinone-9 3-methyltransferase